MEARLFEEGTIPDFTTPEWYAERERAPHLEQGGHRGRLDLAAKFVKRAWRKGAGGVLDLGAGDGGLLMLLRDDYGIPAERLRGYDLQQSNIDGARERGVNVELHDVLSTPVIGGWYKTCAIATEFLEHLVDPHAFLRSLPDTIGFLVASSPAFETTESHYAFHCWAWDQAGYTALVEQAGFTVKRSEITGDFQVLLAQR